MHSSSVVAVDPSVVVETHDISRHSGKPRALISRMTDFWLLGGISFIAWGFAQTAAHFYNMNSAFDRQVGNWPYLFSGLSLICNHPHFISSYRIAYGNGVKRITSHWFTLIAVPVTLFALFYAAYFISSKNAVNNEWFAQTFSSVPGFSSLVANVDPGAELLRWGVWSMWLLVGWHYAKQIYGVMLRYASYDRYSLSPVQRQILRYCLLSVVPTSFIGLAMQAGGYSSMFQDLMMSPFVIPAAAYTVCSYLSLFSVAVFTGCLIQNYIRDRSLPSINFMTPFVAFYLWWFPGLWPQPFAMIMIPFFHSLQYLPFAYRRIEDELNEKKRKNISTTLMMNIVGMLIVGFFMFDLLPVFLDEQLQTKFVLGSSFFMISIIVFLNVHHFFIDASIWRAKK